ncbi:MAG: beta-phosphoglucomutase [Bacilli bacterium]
MIKAVIFDSDGVLVNTDQYHYLSWKKIADKENIYFDADINNQLRGISRENCLNVILKRAEKDYSDEEKGLLLDEKNRIYHEYLEQMTSDSVAPEVIATIDWLKKKGLKVAVGSSSKSTRGVLTTVGLISKFDAVVTGEDVENVKPSPDIFLACAKKLDCEPADILVVEDGVSGIQAAVNAGFVTCGIGEAENYYQTEYPIGNINEVMLIVTKINKNSK